MRKTEKCGGDEEEEKEKEASPCKDVYLTVVAVHCFCSLCCVSSPACSSVLV